MFAIIKLTNFEKFNCNINRVFTYVILLSPIFNVYASVVHNSIGIGDLILIVLFPLLLFLQIYQKKKVVLQIYIIFLLVFYGATMFSIFILQKMEFSTIDIVTRYARDMLYGLYLVCFVLNYFEKEHGIKIYRNIVMFCSLIVIVQFFIFNVLDKSWFPIVSDVALLGGTNSNLIINDRIMHALQNQFMPSAFFLERGDFSWYVLPYVVICLFYSKKKSHFKAIFCSVAIVLSTSASGIICLTLIWCTWALNIIIAKRKNLRDYIILSCGLLIGSIIGGVLLVGTNLLLMISNRFREVDISVTGVQTSGYLRLVKGYDLYDKLPFELKLFGIGTGNLQTYANNNYQLLEKFFQNGMLEYMNGMSYILVSGGCISVIAYMLCMGYYFRRGTKIIKLLIILMISMLCISSFYGSPYYLLYMTFILVMNEKVRVTSNVQTKGYVRGVGI